MFRKSPQMSGEELKGCERLAELQRAKRAHARAVAVHNSAAQILGEATAHLENARRQMRRESEN